MHAYIHDLRRVRGSDVTVFVVRVSHLMKGAANMLVRYYNCTS